MRHGVRGGTNISSLQPTLWINITSTSLKKCVLLFYGSVHFSRYVKRGLSFSSLSSRSTDRFLTDQYEACCYLKAIQLWWIMHPCWQTERWANSLNPGWLKRTPTYIIRIGWHQARDSLFFIAPLPHQVSVRCHRQAKVAEYLASFKRLRLNNYRLYNTGWLLT